MRTALLLCGLATLAVSCAQPPTEQEGLELERQLRLYGYRVVKVLDGQTLLVDLNDRGLERPVRLVGVQAPLYRKDWKQGGGHDAGEYLNELLFGKKGAGHQQRSTVYVRLSFEGWKYGLPMDTRNLKSLPEARLYPQGAVVNLDNEIEAYIWLEGHLLNRLMIDSGYVRADRDSEYSRRQEFIRAEERAQELNLGLWRWAGAEE